MNNDELCLAIGESLPTLFECTPAPQEGVRVRTPLMYPDGGMVDVFVLEQSGMLPRHRFRGGYGLATHAIREHSAVAQAETPAGGYLPDLGRGIASRPAHGAVGCG